MKVKDLTNITHIKKKINQISGNDGSAITNYFYYGKE